MTRGLQLTRRSALRGMGVSLALPWLEAMVPSSWAGGASAEPMRTIVMFVPNGMYMPQWTPARAGALADLGELPPLLASLDAHRRDITVLSGLANTAVASSPNGQKHGLAGPSFLTCTHPHPTHGSDYRAGVSVDQIIAQQHGNRTRLPSLDLSVETPRGGGGCDMNCVYTSNISWRTPTAPAAREISPRATFDLLFGDASRRGAGRRRSVLDYVREESASLERVLGQADRARFAEFQESVRAVERRIDQAVPAPADSPLTNRGPLPAMPTNYAEHARLMIDLLVLALATNQTSVATLMLGNEFSDRSFPEVNIRDSHHTVSHHANAANRIASYARICEYLVTFFGDLVTALKRTREGDGTLLDRSLVLFGGGIGDGNSHDFNDLPIILAGGANGQLRHGHHLQLAPRTPLANLHLTILEKAGIRQPRFADSTGTLRELG